MQIITPFLWFDGDAEKAAHFYTRIFPNSQINEVARMPDGSVLVVNFSLDSTDYIAMNGGPGHPHTDAFSLLVNCKDQKEVDHYWGALQAEGGKEIQCGWLVDKYGVSWQVVPTLLGELMTKAGPTQAQAVMGVVMNSTKLNFADLQKAFDGAS